MSTAVIIAGLCLFYCCGCYVIAQNTRRNYRGPGRWILVGFWPVFIVASPRFRKSLKR